MSSERHRKGLAAARWYCMWHIGDRNWADLILEAYNNPEETERKLQEERDSFD